MKEKVKGLLILLLVYIIAYLIGFGCFILFDNIFENINIYFNLFIADVIATIFIFIVGCFLKTASIYDPYWSVQTIVIYLSLLIFKNKWDLGSILFLIAILFWAIRLTYNFITTFNSLKYIDWRYKMLKEKTNKFYPFVSLLGIHEVPTIIVYAASLPMFFYVINDFEFSYLNLIGLIIMIIATVIELISDYNMHTFIKNRKSRAEINRTGIWKYSRHPNYLGEILFWYGAALVIILADFSYWYLIIGAIMNNCLFLFISIPMAENHMKLYKTDFDIYKKEVRMLLPIPKIKK